MSQEPEQKQHKRLGSRNYSRTLLQGDMDIINKYAAKYVPSRQSILNNSSSYSTYQNKMGLTDSNNNNKSISSSPMSNNAMTDFNNINNMGILNLNNNTNNNNNNMNSTSSNDTQHKRRQPSNLIGSPNFQGLNEVEMNNAHNEMQEAMTSMLTSYQGRVEQQTKFLEDIEQQALNNPNFCKPENADNWTVQEVCHWLGTIHLEKYIQPFSDQTIDGSILLRDLDENILTNELGVKKIHVKKNC